MRLYTFGNFYMSSIQQGIQAAHSQMELFTKYQETSDRKELLFDWAENHRTMICLSAGMNTDLEDLLTFMDNCDNPYPWSFFNEAPESMNSMLTNIAIVLPEDIYTMTSLLRARKFEIIYVSSEDTYAVTHRENHITMTPDEEQFVQSVVNVLESKFQWELIMRLGNYTLAR